MENSQQPLAIESFSYSWLINKAPSFDGLDKPLRPSLDSFEETTYEVVKPKRFLEEEAQNFNFDIPISKSPVSLVHADEIFSDGHIMPVYVDPSNIEVFNSTSVPAVPISSLSSCRTTTACPADRMFHCHFLRKWSKRVLQKCVGLLKPLCRIRVGCSRNSIRVNDIDREVLCEVESWSSSLQASPRRNTAYSTGNKVDVYRRLSWSNSPQISPPHSPSFSTDNWCDIESSINEAVLHCKRSFEK